MHPLKFLTAYKKQTHKESTHITALFRQIFAKGYCYDIVGVTAFYEAVNGLDFSVNTVIAKLTGDETNEFFTLLVLFYQILPVEGRSKYFTVIGVHT